MCPDRTAFNCSYSFDLPDLHYNDMDTEKSWKHSNPSFCALRWYVRWYNEERERWKEQYMSKRWWINPMDGGICKLMDVENLSTNFILWNCNLSPPTTIQYVLCLWIMCCSVSFFFLARRVNSLHILISFN